MKIALFKNVGFDSISIFEPSKYLPDEEKEAYTLPGYVRISEWIDVDFPPLSTDEVVQSQIKVIDEAEQRARDLFHEQLERFKGMRANLLALPAPAQAA
jgi:hypothetical protein